MIDPRTARAYARPNWWLAGIIAFVSAPAGCSSIAQSNHSANPSSLSSQRSRLDVTSEMPLGISVAGGETAATNRASVEQAGGVNTLQLADKAERSEATGNPVSCAPSGTEQTIDLGVALQLAGIDNPTIDLARERIQEALADQLAARSLLVPSVNVGGNYRLHTGALQQSQGDIIKPTSQDLYLGAGAGAVGSGTVALPGVWLFAQLGDAIYEPLAARQQVVARRSDALAVRNSVLLQVATAYLELVGAGARLEILRQGESDVSEIVRITSAFAKAGQGTAADANRALANAELVRTQIREAEGEFARASARLCQLLSVDPTVRLRAPEGIVAPFRLVQEDSDLEQLVDIAARSRPELFAQSAAIEEAQIRVRQEQSRPWLPLIAIGYSDGVFGGGSSLVTDPFSPLTNRSDFDLVAVWNIQNLGFGNHARVRRANAVVGEAITDYDTSLNQVRREVAEGQAAAETSLRQIEVARPALAAAAEGFRLETERIKLGQGRPIETLDSFRQLLQSKLELARAIVAFDIGQFQLFVALGNNPESGPGLENSAGCNGSSLPACQMAR
jgi:outer membrane protein TolC